MAKKLFVGNLSWDTNDASLNQFFSQVGAVITANVVMDKFTNRSRGFGFVEMSSDEEADQAINQLNGQTLDGRAINVNEARPQEDRPRNFDRSGGDRRDNNHRGGGSNRGGFRR